MHTRTETVLSKDIRIGVKVQNNLILAKMEGMGLKNAAELSRAVGISQTELGRMVNMKMLPFTKEGDWHRPALKLAEFFECLPEDLFSEFQRENILEQNRAHVEMDFAEVQAMLAYQNAPLLEPSAQIESRELSSVLGQVLDRMDPKFGKVLRARFGLDGEEMTLEEVGKMLGLTRERARQIETEGLHLLRHPSRSSLLRVASGMTFQKRA